MRLKRKSRQEAEVPTGSFADIAFLLIVFFILTTTFVLPAGSRLDVPAGKSDPDKSEQKQLTILLQKGRIFYGENGTDVTIGELRERLAAEKFAEKKESDRIVILDAAKNVKWQNYFEVFNAIEAAGGVVALMDKEEEVKKTDKEATP